MTENERIMTEALEACRDAVSVLSHLAARDVVDIVDRALSRLNTASPAEPPGEPNTCCYGFNGVHSDDCAAGPPVALRPAREPQPNLSEFVHIFIGLARSLSETDAAIEIGRGVQRLLEADRSQRAGLDPATVLEVPCQEHMSIEGEPCMAATDGSQQMVCLARIRSLTSQPGGEG